MTSHDNLPYDYTGSLTVYEVNTPVDKYVYKSDIHRICTSLTAATYTKNILNQECAVYHELVIGFFLHKTI